MSGGSRRARKKPQVNDARRPRVARGTRPSDDRTPRRARTFNPPDPTGKIVVQFGRFDVGSEWCLSKIEPDELRALLGRIRAIETMTESEAFNHGDEPGKDYPLANLPTRAAQDRLVELEYDDEDQISRFRVTSRGRLYGFRRDERFYALWWDPNPTIWPSKKKNT